MISTIVKGALLISSKLINREVVSLVEEIDCRQEEKELDLAKDLPLLVEGIYWQVRFVSKFQ